jgi:hypothetical protein
MPVVFFPRADSRIDKSAAYIPFPFYYGDQLAQVPLTDLILVKRVGGHGARPQSWVADRQRIARFFPTMHRDGFVASNRQRIA